MTSKHTPGPWAVTDNSWEISSVYAADGFLVAEVNINAKADEDSQDHFEAIKEANARLISAAPELLDALQHLSSVYEHIWVKMTDGEMAIVKGAWEVAEIAISKAEGRS